MADGATAATPVLTKTEDGYVQAVWTTGLLGGLNTGVGASLGPIKTGSAFAQVTGTFGSATAVLEGSLDNTNWFTLYAAQQIAAAGKNDPISVTAAGAFQLLGVPRYIRAKTTGGTSTSLVVTVTALRD